MNLKNLMIQIFNKELEIFHNNKLQLKKLKKIIILLNKKRIFKNQRRKYINKSSKYLLIRVMEFSQLIRIKEKTHHDNLIEYINNNPS